MNKLKLAATSLRDAGYSYTMITHELGISKSTLSNWFRDRPFIPNAEAKRRATNGRVQFGHRKKQARLLAIKTLQRLGRTEIGQITKRDLWMIGLGLWLGEGSKTGEQLRLANSDPTIIALWLRWLREICKFDDSNIAARIHAYSDINEAEAISYWQSITHLPKSSFYKTQYDKRNGKAREKSGRLPHGTLHVSIRSNKDPERGVKFHRRMMGWISAVLN